MTVLFAFNCKLQIENALQVAPNPWVPKVGASQQGISQCRAQKKIKQGMWNNDEKKTHCTKVSCFSLIPLQSIHRQWPPEQPLLLVCWPGDHFSGGRMGGSALPPQASWAGLSSTSSSVPSWLGRSHHGHCVPSGFGQPLGLFGQRSQSLPVQSYAHGWSFPWRCWGPMWVDATKWSLRRNRVNVNFSFPSFFPIPNCDSVNRFPTLPQTASAMTLRHRHCQHHSYMSCSVNSKLCQIPFHPH